MQGKNLLSSYGDCFRFCLNFFDAINQPQAMCIVKIVRSEVQVLDRNLKKKLKIII